MKKRKTSRKNRKGATLAGKSLLIGAVVVVLGAVALGVVSGGFNPNSKNSLFAFANPSSLLGYAAGWNWVAPAQAPPNVQATTPIWAPTSNAGHQCFVQGSNAKLPFQVLSQGTVQGGNPDNFLYYPLTIAAAKQYQNFVGTESDVNDYFFLWANRCATQPGSTPGNVNECVGLANGVTSNSLLYYNLPLTGYDTFKSYKAADDCTLAQEAASFGASQSTVQGYIAGDGLTLLTTTDQIPGLISSNTFHNYCYANLITPAQAAANKGIFLDYEPGDRRTDSIAISFLQQVVTMAHNAGKKVILYTNPLDDPYTVNEGIDSNSATTILNMVDYMSLFLYNGNPEHSLMGTFNAQLQIFKNGNPNVNFSHVMITYDLSNNFSVADAQTAHSLMYQYNIPLLTIFRNLQSVGGLCSTPTNQRLLCLLYAQCGGTPPPPPPTATISAINSNINKGGSTPLKYSCSNSSSATVTQVGNLTPVAGGTTAPVAPTQTTTYTLTCSGSSGKNTSTATVKVNNAPPDLTAWLVPGTTPINVKLGAVVPLEAYVANIGAGPTGMPFWTTFFVDYEGQPFTQLEFPSGDPGPGNPPPGGFFPNYKEIDGTQGAGIKFTPTHTGRYSFRVCADRNASMQQTVYPQSNPSNDCSAWGGINVH